MQCAGLALLEMKQFLQVWHSELFKVKATLKTTFCG